MRHTFCTLLLTVAFLVAASPSAEANPPPRSRAYYPPVYQSAYPNVVVYPQIVTTPYYAPYYGYYPSWSAGYLYSPGYYRYSYSPYWGPSYYSGYPSFYSWYWIR